MHDDPADLDGDGQFDLIDLVIMGEEDDGQLHLSFSGSLFYDMS
jgi:hypothetical protein